MGNDNYKWETYKLGGRGGQHALAQQMEFVSLICHHASDKNIIIYIHNTHPQQVGRKSMFCRVSVRVPFRILVRGGSERGTLGSGHIGVRSIHNVIRKRKKEKICCTQDGFFWTNSAIFPKSVLLSVFFFFYPHLWVVEFVLLSPAWREDCAIQGKSIWMIDRYSAPRMKRGAGGWWEQISRDLIKMAVKIS